MKRQLFFLLFCVMSIFTSCKKEKEISSEVTYELKVKVMAKYGDELLHADKKYALPSGDSILFSELSFYFSNCKMGDKLVADAALFRWTQAEKPFFIHTGSKLPATSLTALLGVDSSVNQSDPSTFELHHPLNILQANDMHWGWNPGYIFVKIEGKVDTLTNGLSSETLLPISYHLGKNSNQRSILFDAISIHLKSDEASKKGYEGVVELDLKKFFEEIQQSINIKENPTCHSDPGQEVLTTNLMEYFSHAFKGVQ